MKLLSLLLVLLLLLLSNRISISINSSLLRTLYNRIELMGGIAWHKMWTVEIRTRLFFSFHLVARFHQTISSLSLAAKVFETRRNIFKLYCKDDLHLILNILLLLLHHNQIAFSDIESKECQTVRIISNCLQNIYFYIYFHWSIDHRIKHHYRKWSRSLRMTKYYWCISNQSFQIINLFRTHLDLLWNLKNCQKGKKKIGAHANDKVIRRFIRCSLHVVSVRRLDRGVCAVHSFNYFGNRKLI